MPPYVDTTIIGVLDPRRMPPSLTIDLMEDVFSQCRLLDELPPPRANKPFRFYMQTEEGCEAICPCEELPEEVEAVMGRWRSFRVKKKCHVPSSVILARIVQPLSVAGIEVLTASSGGADYVLVQESDLPRAEAMFLAAGHKVVSVKEQPAGQPRSAKTGRRFQV